MHIIRLSNTWSSLTAAMGPRRTLLQDQAQRGGLPGAFAFSVHISRNNWFILGALMIVRFHII